MGKNITEEIEKLKKERNAIILAHYYQPDEIQEIADYVGDSYYLSEIARDLNRMKLTNLNLAKLNKFYYSYYR